MTGHGRVKRNNVLCIERRTMLNIDIISREGSERWLSTPSSEKVTGTGKSGQGRMRLARRGRSQRDSGQVVTMAALTQKSGCTAVA